MIYPQSPGLRLTGTSATPETTSDVSNITTLYYTPDVSGIIWLYVGGRWRQFQTAEISLALGTLTASKPYDVFAFATGGTVALEFLVWTSASARATAIVRQDGFRVKSGDATRLLVGTFYTSSTTQTQDTLAQRFISNVYNTRRRLLRSPSETTDNWAGAGGGAGVWRQVRAQAANKFELVQCEPRFLDVKAMLVGSTTIPVASIFTGVGIDSTTVCSCQNGEFYNCPNTSGYIARNQYFGFPNTAGGYNAINWLEGDSSNVTFYGDAGNTYVQSGMWGSVQG